MNTASTQTSPRPRANSMKRAAEVLAISDSTLGRMIKAGTIKTVKVSTRRRVITDAEIERVLSGQAA